MSEITNNGWVKLGADNASSIGYFTTDSDSAVFTIGGGKFSFEENASTIAADKATDIVLVDSTSNSVQLKTPFIDTNKEITINGANYKFTVATDAKVAFISDSTTVIGSSGADTIRTSNNAHFSIDGGGGNDIFDIEKSRGAVTITGGAGNDSLYASDVTVSKSYINKFDVGNGTNTISLNYVSVGSAAEANGGKLYIFGGTGTDLINIENITVSGTDAEVSVTGNTGGGSGTKDTITIENLYSYGGTFNVNGRNSDALVSVKGALASNGTINVRGSAGSDTLVVEELTVKSGGYVEVIGNDYSDSIKVNNVILEQNYDKNGLKINGNGNGATADVVEVSNVTIGGNAEHGVWLSIDYGYGSANNTIKVSDALLKANGAINIKTFTGADHISIENVTLTGLGNDSNSAVSIQANNGNDVISIKNSNLDKGALIKVQGEAGNDSIAIEGATLDASNLHIFGDAGTDTISVKNVSLASSWVSIEGGDGDDLISFENVTLSGANTNVINLGAGADTVSITTLLVNDAPFSIIGGAGKNSLTIDDAIFNPNGTTNISLGAEADTIDLKNVNVNGGTVNAYVDSSDDLNLDKITVTSGLFNLNYDSLDNNITVSKFDELGENGTVGVYAGAGNDTISVSAFTVSNGTFNVFGDAGADSISFSGFTVSGGNVNVDGGEGADILSFSNISVKSAQSNLSVSTGEGADTVNLSNITVTSGVFNVYGDGSTASLDSDLFNIANVTGVSIISGANDSDTFALDTTSGTFVSIAGLGATDKFSIASFEAGNASISTDGVIVIGKASIAANGITNADTVANNFYGVSVKVGTSDSVLGDLIDPKEWASVAADTFTWGRDHGNDHNLISISGGWNYASINADTFKDSLKGAMDGDTLTVDVGWLGKEDVLFTAKTGASVGFGETTVRNEVGEWSTIGSTQVIYKNAGNFAYSITAGTGDSAISTIDAVDQRDILVTISGGGLASSVTGAETEFVFDSQTNVASLGAAAFNIVGGQISVFGAADATNYTFDFSAAKDATIGASLGANIAAGSSSINILGSDYADTVAIGAGLQNISVFGGEGADEFNIGGTGTITANGGKGDDTFNITNGINITVIGGAGADTFSISGGNNISISSDKNDSDTFAFNLSSGANITISDLDTSDVISLNQTISSGSVTDKGVLILGNASITANNLNAAGGFASLYSVAVQNGTGAGSETTTLGDLIDKIEWHARTENPSVAAYGRRFGATSDTIVLSGLASVASQVATLNARNYIDGTFVTFDSDVLITAQTTPITLTSSTYHAKLDDDSKVVYNPESYSTISPTSVAYKSANTVAGYDVVPGNGSDTIIYIAAASSEATISGLATDFDLSAIQFGNDVFTISAAALGTDSNTPATLNTAAGYTLTVGADVSGSDTRKAYWLADASIATFYAGQGTVAGYNVAEGGKSIVYTPQTDGTKTIEISGLKGISASNNLIAGITLSEKDSTVTIAKTIIDTAGASIKEGAGYNYALGGKGALISNISAGGVTLTGSTSNDSLTNKGGASVLEGGKGNDVIVAGAGGDTISAGVGNDSITLGAKADSVFYSGGNDVITGYAAGDTITLAEGKIVREASFDSTTNDLTVKLNSGKITFKNAKDTEIAVGDKIYKNNLVYNADKTELTLNKSATSLSADDITASIKSIDASNVSTGLTITSKNTTETTILGGKGTDYLTGIAGADSLDGGKGNDTLNGGAGNDTLTGDKGDDVFIYSGGKDVITDYGTGKDIINISNAASVVADSSVDKDGNVILTFDSDNTLTLTKANGAVVSMTSGSSSVVSAQIYGNHSTMNTKKTGVTLGAAYNDSGNSFDATSYSSMITIDGSAVTANTTLTGNAKANKIYGGDGNDMLIGGAGNDTLTGNAGSDTFVYSTGKDVITDFDAAADKISLTVEGGVTAITNATYSGDASDTLILTINKQTLKIEADKDASLAGKSISIDGKAYTFDKNLINDGTSVTMYSAFKGTYTAADGITNVNGSAANGAMNITGTGAGDTLYGGKKADTLNGGAGADSINGGAGNDSIYGGAGKDTLFGGAGKDIFVFGADEGEDIIEDYTAGEDKIKLINGAEITATAQSGEADIEFTIGTSGKVIVQKAAGSAITVIDANGKTTTQIYGGSSSSSRTLDLLYDNNFMTDDAALDDITEAKYSVTQIETDSKDELEKAQALLTYSEDK